MALLDPIQDAPAFRRIAKMLQSSETPQELFDDLPYKLGENYVVSRLPEAETVPRNDPRQAQITLMFETAAAGFGFKAPSGSTTRRETSTITTGPVESRTYDAGIDGVSGGFTERYQAGGTRTTESGSTGTTHTEDNIGDTLLEQVDEMIAAFEGEPTTKIKISVGATDPVRSPLTDHTYDDYIPNRY